MSPLVNCVICGSYLSKTSRGLHCPNHGFIQMNQEWDKLKVKKNGKKEKKR